MLATTPRKFGFLRKVKGIFPLRSNKLAEFIGELDLNKVEECPKIMFATVSVKIYLVTCLITPSLDNIININDKDHNNPHMWSLHDKGIKRLGTLTCWDLGPDKPSKCHLKFFV